MSLQRIRTLLAAILLLCTGAAAASAQDKCPATEGVPAARVTALARGFNLTGWLDNAPPRRPSVDTLAQLRVRGFTHVRLPVQPELLLTPFSAPDAAARQWDELDAALGSLLALDLTVSLDLHPGDGIGKMQESDPERAFGILEDLWRKLARRYGTLSPERIFFEVLNEPTASAAIWQERGPRLAAAIRAEAPRHTIVYGPSGPQTIRLLESLKPLADPNVVYAIHFYQPMAFTHQGLDWSPGDPLQYLEGVPFPAQMSSPAIRAQLARLSMQGRVASASLLAKELAFPWTEASIADAFARAGVWAARNKAPLILNEFGVLRWKAGAADRARWIEAVRRAAERNCIGWAHWEYADGFGFVERTGKSEKPDETILRALLAR